MTLCAFIRKSGLIPLRTFDPRSALRKLIIIGKNFLMAAVNKAADG